MLTIAHITDLHITSAADPLTQKRHEERLRQVLRAIAELKPRPAAILATGDLVHWGEAEEYAELKRIFADVAVPTYFGVGNHDRRAAFRAAFPATPADANGFIQYTLDLGALRVIMLDSLDESDNRGAFCERRAAWLARALDDASNVPTLIAIHHPPIRAGIQWMCEPTSDDDWIERLRSTLAGRGHVVGLVSGHLHRAFHGMFAGHMVSVSSATAVQLTLDLRDIDRQRPDHRDLVVEEPPGFSLLTWEESALTVHNCVAGDYRVAATFERPLKD